MEKNKSFIRAFLLGVLLTPVVLHGLENVKLDTDVRLTWNATRQDPGPRCLTLRVPEPGHVLIELTTTIPSTAPGILILAPSEAEAPATLERIESVLLRMKRAGKHPICLTSESPRGRVEIIATFVSDEVRSKERDEEETELEPDR